MATNDEFPPKYLDWLRLSLFPSNDEGTRTAQLPYVKFMDLMFRRDLAGFRRLISQAHWQVACLQ